MRKRLLFLLFLLLFIWISTIEVFAKILPQAKKGTKTQGLRYASGSSVAVSPRLRGDRRALTIYFGNLQNVSSVSYTLTYQTNGIQEGAGGTVSGAGSSATRELLFGTCSAGVCRYHTNITNMKLEITSQLKSGKTSIKRYKIRV